MKAPLRLALALAAAWLLAGCSAVRLAYDNAGIYLHWQAMNYLALDDPGAEELEARIGGFLAWHRTGELPRYVQLAREAERRLGDGLSPGDLVWGYDSLRTHAARSLREAAERIAPLLDRLTPQQLAQIEKRFAEDNRRFARENLRGTEQERRKRRAERVEQRLEDWVGSLSQAQLRRIRQYSERAPLAAELRDRDRRRLQAEILAMVRAREAHKRLPELAQHWERGREPAFVAANQAWREELFALLLDLDRSLSPEQRARAAGQLRRYAEDFAILAGRAAP